MYKPEFFKGRPIIQPGEVYEIDGELFKVITATANILGENSRSIKMSTLTYWLDNVETNERTYFKESELESKFKECNPSLN